MTGDRVAALQLALRMGAAVIEFVKAVNRNDPQALLRGTQAFRWALKQVDRELERNEESYRRRLARKGAR